MRWIVLLAACVVPGFALIGCSSDGVTPSCSEAPLYHNRYDEDDRAEYEKLKANPEELRKLQPNADQDPAALKQLDDDKCITGSHTPSANSSGGSSNGGSGGSGTGGTTGGTGGTN